MKRKYVITILLCLLVGMPAAFAVFNEKNLAQTLSVLRFELDQQNDKMETSRSRINQRKEMQHMQMVSMVKKCNELSLILYSQNQDYTFDVTYALKEVSDQYRAFNERKMPFDQIVSGMNLEIERYERLAEALRRLPPVLDEISEVPDSISMAKDSVMLDIDPAALDSARSAFRAHAQHAAAHAPHGKAPHAAAHQEHGLNTEDVINILTGAREQIEEDPAERNTFLLSEDAQADRDTCLAYARNLLKMYTESRDKIIEDTLHYAELSNRINESYEYAQNRYRVIQKNIFVEGQDPYFTVIKRFRRYSRQAFQEAHMKYSTADSCEDEHHHHSHSEWRGPVVIGFIVFVLLYLIISALISYVVVRFLHRRVKRYKDEKEETFRQRKLCITLLLGAAIFALTVMIAVQFVNQNFFAAASRLLLVYAWLLAAIFGSLLIRVAPEKLNKSLKVYTPIIIIGLIVITFRIIFIPNKLVNLIFPPLLLIFTLWQFLLCKRVCPKLDRSDMVYSWISFAVMLAMTIVAWKGYVLMAVQIFIWWLFQIAALNTITAGYELLGIYEKGGLTRRRAEYRKNHVVLAQEKNAAFIEVTWLFDLLKQVAVPVLAILSIPFCIWMASDVFDLTEICKTIFYKPFFNLSDADGNAILHLSLYKIVLVSSLFFVFKYVAYISKAMFRHHKLQSAMAQNTGDFVHTNQVNLTLANNVLSIVVWGTYVIIAIILLKIPMGAISIVAAGLATGIGLALKDVLNNFIYGIQLMAGRLRVGDYIECDGVRGQVEGITYQSTQIATLEGDIMAFTNTTLFNKNFRNLTKDSPYVFVKLVVGVNYGANIQHVRELLLEALNPFLTEKDKYGRNVIEPKHGINIFVDGFGDNCIDIGIKQNIIVESQPSVMGRMREAIYTAIDGSDVSIPFPQRDIYIKEFNQPTK